MPLRPTVGTNGAEIRGPGGVPGSCTLDPGDPLRVLPYTRHPSFRHGLSTNAAARYGRRITQTRTLLQTRPGAPSLFPAERLLLERRFHLIPMFERDTNRAHDHVAAIAQPVRPFFADPDELRMALASSASILSVPSMKPVRLRGVSPGLNPPATRFAPSAWWLCLTLSPPTDECRIPPPGYRPHTPEWPDRPYYRRLAAPCLISGQLHLPAGNRGT